MDFVASGFTAQGALSRTRVLPKTVAPGFTVSVRLVFLMKPSVTLCPKSQD